MKLTVKLYGYINLIETAYDTEYETAFATAFETAIKTKY